MTEAREQAERFMAFRKEKARAEAAARAKRIYAGRTCASCKTWKPADQFGIAPLNQNLFKLQKSRCRACDNAYKRDRYNPEKEAERKRRYREVRHELA